MNKSIVIICCVISCLCSAQQWQSSKVYYANDGRLQYPRDSGNNRIPDFSYAGYKKGESAIPTVSTVLTISPVAGDNTTHIQNAINQVGAMTLVNGIRGALLLNAGVYRVSGTLKVNFDGVVLRGAGSGADSTTNTIILATGDTPHQRSVIVAGGGTNNKWSGQVSGTKTNITSDTVLVGDSVLTVASASALAAGDNIIIYHPSTDAWLQAIDYGGTHSSDPGAEPGVDIPWAAGDVDILYNRYIKSKSGNVLTLDIPVYNHLIKSLSQAYVYKYNRSGLITNIGIESLRVDSEYASAFDENHAWQAIDIFQAEDAWVRNCTAIHFGQAGFRTATATRVTIENCTAIDPVSLIEGERRYNLCLYLASQQILFKDCHAQNGRHHCISNGASSTSGNVFLNITSSGSYATSEGHRLWTQGILFDNYRELDGPRAGYTNILLALYNRGYYGTSHGWAIIHSVAWNCNVLAGDLLVQKPPTGQNYGIGCFAAHVSGSPPYAPFNEPAGFIEGSNTAGLFPSSLYQAQLQERLGVYSEPTVQSTNATAFMSASSQAAVECMKGDGALRIVLAKKDSPVDAAPSDFVTYTANANFGSGAVLGSGNYVVYKGVGDSFAVSGLSALSTYHFAVFEFNGIAGTENYFPTNPARANISTGVMAIQSNGTGGGVWDSAATWSGGIIPDSTMQAVVQGSDSIRVTRSGIKIYNISVPSGGKIVANGSNIASGNVRYLIVTGKDIVNNGMFGTGSDGLSIKIVDSCRISGSSPVKLARVLPMSTTAKVVFDVDVLLTYRAGATSSGGALVLTDGGTAPVPNYKFSAVTLNAGKTLTFSNYSKLQQNSTQDQDWNVSTAITLNGTVLMGDSSTSISLRASTGYSISLTVNGSLSCRVLNPSSMSGNNGAVITINAGGVLKVGQGISGNCDFSNPSVFISGAGTFQLLPACGITIGSPWGLDTILGHIRTAQRIFSSSTSYTFNGTSPQRSGSGMPDSVNNLTLNNNAGLKLDRDIAVGGTLALTAGKLFLADNDLVLSASSGISGTPSPAKMIVADSTGSLVKRVSGLNSFTFPLGDTLTINGYTPITVSLSAGSLQNAVISARCIPKTHYKNFSRSNYIRRYWSVTSTGISGMQAQVNGTYADGDIFGVESSLQSGKWDTVWTKTGTISPSNNQLSFSSLASLGDFTAGDSLYIGAGGVVKVKMIPEGYYEQGRQHLALSDTFTVTLASAASPYASLASETFVLDSLAYSGSAAFSYTESSPVYTVVKGRNIIETWTAEPVPYGKGTVTEIDFTADSTAAFGSNLCRKGNVFCVYSGDVNQDGIVDYTDLSITDNGSNNFLAGYLPADVNGDMFVDFSDLSLVDNNQYNFVSVVKPGLKVTAGESSQVKCQMRVGNR